MKRFFTIPAVARLAMVVLAGGLAAACSTYQPLDRGSHVPWAHARPAAESPRRRASGTGDARREDRVMAAGRAIGCSRAIG